MRRILYEVRLMLYGMRRNLYEVCLMLYEMRRILYEVCLMLYGLRRILYEVRLISCGVRPILQGPSTSWDKLIGQLCHTVIGCSLSSRTFNTCKAL